MSKFLITCGGTGGHLAPGIAVAERLEADGHTCCLIISRKEVDSRLIQGYPDLTSVRVPGSPLSAHPVAFVRFLVGQMGLFAFAFRFVRRERPDAVVAFGGFITTGFAVAAFCHRISLILHESNRKPGRAIRLLHPLADRVYLPEGVSLKNAPRRVVRHLGFPLRECVKLTARSAARRELGIDNTGKVLVILGGSQGAQALNDWIREGLKRFAREGINVCCLTGLGNGESGVTELISADGRRVKGIFQPFSDQMGDLLSAADLVVARAGAGTIAEVVHCRVPAILVPYPYSADEHQLENARFLERQGGCVVVEQSRLQELHAEVMDVIFNDWLLAKLRKNLSRLRGGDFCEQIVADIQRIVEDRGGGIENPQRGARIPA